MFEVIDTTIGVAPLLQFLPLTETWAQGLGTCVGFARAWDGSLVLLDSEGQHRYAPPGRFETLEPGEPASVVSMHGTVVYEPRTGRVLEVDLDPEYLDVPLVFDVKEWRECYPRETLDGSSHDIMDLGYWTLEGYVPANPEFRKDIHAGL